MRNLLQSVDWIDVFMAEPGVGVTVVTNDGEVPFSNEAAQNIFEVDKSRFIPGIKLSEYFDHRFVEERMGWVNQVLETNSPMQVKHIYHGKKVISSLYPIMDDGSSSVLVISREDGIHDDPTNAEVVSSNFIDLGPLSSLSPRELEVFVLLGHGNSVPEVAKQLYRSPRTIERHKNEIGRKLGISSLSAISHTVGRVGLTVDHLRLERFQAILDRK